MPTARRRAPCLRSAYRRPCPPQQFEAYWHKKGAVGYYDYGTLSMALTLGGHANEVITPGRKVLVGWVKGDGTVPATQCAATLRTVTPRYIALTRYTAAPATLRTTTVRAPLFYRPPRGSSQLGAAWGCALSGQLRAHLPTISLVTAMRGSKAATSACL